MTEACDGTSEDGARCWRLWRQDDHGNRFLVWSGSERAAAEARLAELESGHPHKQLYWISDADGDGPCATS